MRRTSANFRVVTDPPEMTSIRTQSNQDNDLHPLPPKVSVTRGDRAGHGLSRSTGVLSHVLFARQQMGGLTFYACPKANRETTCQGAVLCLTRGPREYVGHAVGAGVQQPPGSVLWIMLIEVREEHGVR